MSFRLPKKKVIQTDDFVLSVFRRTLCNEDSAKLHTLVKTFSISKAKLVTPDTLYIQTSVQKSSSQMGLLCKSYKKRLCLRPINFCSSVKFEVMDVPAHHYHDNLEFDELMQVFENQAETIELMKHTPIDGLVADRACFRLAGFTEDEYFQYVNAEVDLEEFDRRLDTPFNYMSLIREEYISQDRMEAQANRIQAEFGQVGDEDQITNTNLTIPSIQESFALKIGTYFEFFEKVFPKKICPNTFKPVPAQKQFKTFLYLKEELLKTTGFNPGNYEIHNFQG